MSIRFKFIFFIFFSALALFSSSASAQNNQFTKLFGHASDKIIVPFDYINGFIVVKVKLQYDYEVNLILDTGAENLILFNSVDAIDNDIPRGKRIKISGSDLHEGIQAYISRHVALSINDSRTILHDIVILEEDFMNISSLVGMRIDGLIGGRIFWNMVLSINFARKKLTLLPKSAFKDPKKKFEKFDIEIDNYKPFLKLTTQLSNGEVIPLKLLIDSGSTIALLLYLNTHNSLTLPEKYILGTLGKGISGDITGYIGKTKSLDISKKLSLGNLVTHFQNADTLHSKAFLNDRNGLLGSPILSKFDVKIDYVDSKLYLKPNRYYKSKLAYDLSGLSIYAFGPKLDSYVVKEVLKDTPADQAGVKSGDIIKRIGLFSTNFYTMNSILNKMSKKEGKTIRLVLDRNGQKIKVKFKLTDYLKS